ncbi:MAG: GMC family oxidoreductase N-terminal domain-containing protein [Polyangiaceae bacterium]
MTGTIVEGRTVSSSLTMKASVVVVGTGAGGSVVFRELAAKGVDVVALEDGGNHRPSSFTQREDEMLPRLFWDGGGLTTKDMAIRVLQGRGVGGSTIHNTNLCKRTPDPILELWAKNHAVSGLRPAELSPLFDQIERELSVERIPDSLVNRNNDVLRRGSTALGWRGGVLKHNRIGCQQSGFCELGCAYDAKQNAAKVFIPQGVQAGGRVYSDARVQRVVHERGQIKGVSGVFLDAAGNEKAPFTIDAPIVVLAASATASAALAIVSGLPDPYGQLGRGLRMHPGAVVSGCFDSPIEGHHGIPQSYECTEHLSFEEGSDKRIWIIPAFAHPIGTASTLPGFGAAHMKSMRAYRNIAVLTAMLHDDSSGRVTASDAGRPVLDYKMNEGDRSALAKGLVACARIMFAAGAKEVTIPAIPPVTLRSVAELDALDTSFVRPHSVPLSAVHPMGTMRMGDDPKRSVVTSRGEHHQQKGLFVADGSLFPTSIGGPPQISIYTFGLHVSRAVLEAAQKG